MCVGSKGTTLQRTISSVLTTIGRVERISPPNSTLGVIRCKDLDDTYSGLHAEGHIEGGQCSASLFYDPVDDQHEVIVTSVHDTDFTTAGKTPADRKVAWAVLFAQLTPTRTWGFTGIATQFNVTANVGEPLKADLTIEVERSTTLPV